MPCFDFFWKSSLWRKIRVKAPFSLLGKVYWRFDSQLKTSSNRRKCADLNKKIYSLSCKSSPYDFGEIYVSLTTYPARIESAYYAICSILDQTVCSNKVILTLIKEEFPNGEDSLPLAIKSLKEKGLEILWGDDNLRPHNKYFYSMQKYPKALIITIDDDILYPNDTIEKLINSYKKFPNSISAFHTDKFSFRNNQLDDYSKSIIGYNQEILTPKIDLLAEGFAGVLYPPSILPQETFNKDTIKICSPLNDDIWLKCIELKNNIPVVCATKKHNIQVLSTVQNTALFIQNRQKNYNDEQLRRTQTILGINVPLHDKYN